MRMKTATVPMIPKDKVTHRAQYIAPRKDFVKFFKRVCLTCEKSFTAKGRFNRICSACKERDVSPYRYIGGING